MLVKIISAFFHIVKRILSLIFSRPGIIVILILAQVAMMFAVPGVLAVLFPEYYDEIMSAMDYLLSIFSAIAVIYIVSKDENPYFKISWICLFFFFPVIGFFIYLFMANRQVPKVIARHTSDNIKNINQSIPAEIIKQPQHESNLLQSRYVKETSAYPVLANTEIKYFTLGDIMFPAFLEDLKKAEKYIFIEFFIVEQGVLMEQLLEVLVDRINHGVEVFFMYDDFGSLLKVPSDYPEQLRALGINARVFNPVRPRINPVLNYRDHRKIIVVDGKVAFSGGMNLADEYINKKEIHGHWKDTGVRLEGDAVWPFALMFMQQWNLSGKDQKLGSNLYKPDFVQRSKAHGYVQVYADDPMAKYNIAEKIYLDAIWQAKEYIYITTPYLIIDNAMEDALCTAAISGVDVVVMTPKIYDKVYVHLVTRSAYKKLLANGVKIYEYTPGFLHSKTFVSDDRIAMVGTTNLDFRSFYHHFECSALIYENDVLLDVKKDILDTMQISSKITKQEMDNQPIYIRILQSILKLFAPML